MYREEIGVGWHKEKKGTLLTKHKGKGILHPTSTAQQVLQQKPRPKQTIICKLALLSVGSITYLEIVMMQPTKCWAFLLNAVLLHKLTRLF